MKYYLQTFPFFGVQPELLDENGEKIIGEGEGYLVFNRPWPGIMRTVYGDHKRFEETYFSRFPGYYCTGDGNLKAFCITQTVVLSNLVGALFRKFNLMLE